MSDDQKRIEALEGQVFFLQGMLAQVFNQLSPAQKAAAKQAMAGRGKPSSGEVSAGYQQAAALFGRESR